MKALMIFVKEWASEAITISNRVGGVYEPADITGKAKEEMKDCLLVLFQVESKDGQKQVKDICDDIKKIARNKKLVIEAFDHLSSSQATPTVAKDIAFQVLEKCRQFEGFEVKTSPFGWNKSLMLKSEDIQSAFNYRSY